MFYRLCVCVCFKAILLHNMKNTVPLWYIIKLVVYFAFYIFRQCFWVPIILPHTDSYRQIVRLFDNNAERNSVEVIFCVWVCIACKCSVHVRVLRCNQTASSLAVVRHDFRTKSRIDTVRFPAFALTQRSQNKTHVVPNAATSTLKRLWMAFFSQSPSFTYHNLHS